MKQKKDCYTGIFNTLDTIESRISTIKEQLRTLKEGFCTTIPGSAPTETTDAIIKTPLDTDSQGES